MAFEFHLPDIGEGVVEGEIVSWKVKVGDVVKLAQPIVEIMTDKATVEIPSPRARTSPRPGRLARRFIGGLDHTTDAPQRQVEPGCQFSQFMPLAGRCGKHQFVIVATGQLATARQQGFGPSRQARKLGQEYLGIEARAFGDVAQIGEQAVGYVDRGMRQALRQQSHAEIDSRPWTLQGGPAAGGERFRQEGSALQVRQPESGQSGLPGYPQIVAGQGTVSA